MRYVRAPTRSPGVTPRLSSQGAVTSSRTTGSRPPTATAITRSTPQRREGARGAELGGEPGVRLGGRPRLRTRRGDVPQPGGGRVQRLCDRFVGGEERLLAAGHRPQRHEEQTETEDQRRHHDEQQHGRE